MKTSAHDFGMTPLPVLTRENAPNPARMRKETLPLDGIWNLSVNDGPVQPVSVPFPPQAKVNGIAVPKGEVRLTYATTFELPSAWQGGLLHFEGVDWEAEVFLNGQPLGRHAGAYDPFCFFVPRSVLSLGLPADTTMLHALEVVVRDSSSRRNVLTGKQERKPREGNIFYGNMSGLWKSAWIEHVSESHVADFYVDADSAGNLSVSVEVRGARDGQSVALRLCHEDSDNCVLATAPVLAGRAAISARVEDVRAWTLDVPHLYFGSLSLLADDGTPLDTVETHVGFRDMVMKDGYYRLNGEPFYFQGLLNQAIYPDTLYTPTDQHTLTDYEHTRANGFTGERRHQTTPRHRDLWLADRMGYWLSIELPSGRNLLRQKDREQALLEWRRIIRAYAWNHPSVFFLVPGNENWGMLNHPYHEVGASNAEREQFQYDLGYATEDTAPRGMPYAANDGWKMVTCRKNGQIQSQLDPNRLMFNIHDYAGNAKLRSMYGGLAQFPEAGTWGTNPKHVFHSAAYSYDGQTPVMLSEVGGRALLNRPSKGVFAYGKLYRDAAEWVVELDELITLMGDMPVLRGGYVLTQTRDAGNDPEDESSLGELNGILDGHGIPKHAGDDIRLANERARAAWARLIPQPASQEATLEASEG